MDSQTFTLIVVGIGAITAIASIIAMYRSNVAAHKTAQEAIQGVLYDPRTEQLIDHVYNSVPADTVRPMMDAGASGIARLAEGIDTAIPDDINEPILQGIDKLAKGLQYLADRIDGKVSPEEKAAEDQASVTLEPGESINVNAPDDLS